MKRSLLAASLILLAGCTITKEPEVTDVNPATGLVRLHFNETMLQKARYDDYTTQGTANRQCQQMGYATAIAFGQPVKTCSVISGSLCLNETVTLQYQCQGHAVNYSPAGVYY